MAALLPLYWRTDLKGMAKAKEGRGSCKKWLVRLLLGHNVQPYIVFLIGLDVTFYICWSLNFHATPGNSPPSNIAWWLVPNTFLAPMQTLYMYSYTLQIMIHWSALYMAAQAALVRYCHWYVLASNSGHTNQMQRGIEVTVLLTRGTVDTYVSDIHTKMRIMKLIV